MLRINRPRSLSKLYKNIRTLCTAHVSPTPSKQALDLSPTATQINDQNTSVPPTDPTARKPLNFLKFGLLGVLTGASVTAGYATYGTFKFSSFVVILMNVVTYQKKKKKTILIYVNCFLKEPVLGIVNISKIKYRNLAQL